MIITSLAEMIGNTPLIEIPKRVHQCPGVTLYAKLELLNPFGSIKDRIAQAMLAPHYERLKKLGAGVVENSSGNTAKALQALCAPEGIPFSLVSGLARVPEQREILKLMGTTIEEVPQASDCFDPNDPNDPQYELERRAAASGNSLLFTSQFTNPLNPSEHARSTGAEIARDLPRVDYLIAGVGTAGSSCGAATTLRQGNPDLKLIGLTAHAHDNIPGIRSAGELWENGVFDRASYHDLIAMSSADAIDGMLTLIRRCGIPAGPSSGANYAGAIRTLRNLPAGSPSPTIAVFFACDRMEPYLSYVKERRPDIFDVGTHGGGWHDLSAEEVLEGPMVSVEDFEILRQEKGTLTVDTRSAVAFRLEHIPGSINIPLEHLEQICRLGNPFPIDRTVVLVCQRGVFTRPVATFIAANGGQSYSLEGGFKAWTNRYADVPQQVSGSTSDRLPPENRTRARTP
jgi:S-sulfo-L-cysteine synthase (O-acetyl-L-serine-dependent)